VISKLNQVIKFLILGLFLILSPNFLYANEIFVAPDSQFVDSANIKVQEVVQFKILKMEKEKDLYKATIELKTKNDFKIYEDKLNFNLHPQNNLPHLLKYTSLKPPESYFDPFYKKEKKIFKNSSVFYIESKSPFQSNDKLEIDIQSCSNAVCLVPAKLAVYMIEGNISDLNNTNTFSNKVNNQTTNLNNQVNVNKEAVVEKTEMDTSEKITLLNDNIAFQIQEALKKGSWILFPALFLAGLLMNLTPCVYPMIPITLNVMSQFGQSNSRKQKIKSLPIIYVGGMIITYSLLGVFAGMTGNIFGAQLANPIFNWIIAIVMFLLGLSMLGVFNFTAVQSFANKIPLAQNYPRTAVVTMGAVSGLISAPCTGPVLSTILLLIAQNKNPVSGFTYMLFFAIGFGLPYVALGFFGQRLSRMPKFPRLLNFIKIFFASLMFALALYYARATFQKIPYIQDIFSKPQFLSIAILLLLSVTFIALSTKKDILGKISKIGMTLTCCILALWLTLFTSNSFYHPKNISHAQNTNPNGIKWETNFDDAVVLSKQSGKPILVDIWAEWCTACLEMEETTWKDKKLIEYINTNFIPVKLDYTELADNIQNLVNRWEVNGLPATSFFKANSNFNDKPDILYQGYASGNKILSAAININNKN
jgi:thiol:disulfide interchange protein DsbD